LATIALGVGLLVGGYVSISTARDTRDEVQNEIVSENIRTADDAAIPNVKVDSPEKAKAQADIIKKHSLKATGGKTYAELGRDDPSRNTYLTGVNLRTSLSSYIMAYKLTQFIEAFGWLLIAGAVVTFAVGTPTVYTVTHH
jgi:hypothetical protein